MSLCKWPWNSLRVWNMLIAVIYLVYGLIWIALACRQLAGGARLRNETLSEAASMIWVFFVLLYSVAIVVVAMCLLAASFMRTRYMLMPYLVIGGLHLIIMVSMLVYSIIRDIPWEIIINIILLMVFSASFAIVVCFYNELRRTPDAHWTHSDTIRSESAASRRDHSWFGKK